MCDAILAFFNASSSTTLFAAVSAIAAAVSAVAAIATTILTVRHHRELANEAQRRCAASISCWFERDKIRVCNRNDTPVYDIVISAVYPTLSSSNVFNSRPTCGEEVIKPNERVRFPMLPPGEYLADRPHAEPECEKAYELELAFCDTAGTRWIRRANGALERIMKKDGYPYSPESIPHLPSHVFPTRS